MREPQPAELDPAHILAVCARATGGQRGLAVRKADAVIVCILPSRRAADRSSTALARVGYEVTSVSADRGRDLLVAGWDPAALESRLATMRTVRDQLTGNPSLTAKAVIERFRRLPVESSTPELQWELLNQARVSLRDWVITRSGVHALQDSTIQAADAGIAPRLRFAAVLEKAIDDRVERQLRVAGYALGLFRHLSELPADVAQDTAIRWADLAVRLDGPAARDLVHLMPGAAALAHGAGTPDCETARTSDPALRPLTLATGSPGQSRPASRIADEFPHAALAPDRSTNVVSLDAARHRARPGRIPRPRL